jgi:predicted HTH transcriptional regulator
MLPLVTTGDPTDEPTPLQRRFRDLLDFPAETRNRDNKAGRSWPTIRKDNRFRLCLVRDIMAMGNTAYGGVIVIGIADKTHQLTGVAETDLGSWDQSSLFEAVTRHSSPPPRFRVERARMNGHWFVAVEVEEFEEIPCVCILEGNVEVPPSQRSQVVRPEVILRRGGLYIRSEGAQTVEIDREELTRGLIARAISRKGDHLLRQIEDLVNPASGDAGPAAYQDQADAASSFLRDV